MMNPRPRRAARSLVLSTCFFTALAALVPACGGDPPPAAPATPPPGDPPPPPADPAPPPAPPAPPEVAWTTIVDFASLPAPHTATADDKKLIALATDIKKSHKECTGATPVVTSHSQSQGSFTAKGVKENAYLVEWDCNPKGAKTPAPEKVFHRLLIVGGEKNDKLSREVEVPERLIGTMTDLDNDGDNELVLVSSPGTLSARLVELGDAPAGQLAAVFAWPSLGTSECAPTGDQDAPKLLYRKTDSQEFKADRGKRPCPVAATPAAPASKAAPAPAAPKKK
jgi:hypothetical protein